MDARLRSNWRRPWQSHGSGTRRPRAAVGAWDSWNRADGSPALRIDAAARTAGEESEARGRADPRKNHQRERPGARAAGLQSGRPGRLLPGSAAGRSDPTIAAGTGNKRPRRRSAPHSRNEWRRCAHPPAPPRPSRETGYASRFQQFRRRTPEGPRPKLGLADARGGACLATTARKVAASSSFGGPFLGGVLEGSRQK